MKKLDLKKLTLGICCTFTLSAHAAPIIMQGDFVKTAVSDNGTLGYGGIASPGILHDPSGTGTFGTDDYLTPGNPHEGFSIKSDQTGILRNNNSGVTFGIPGTISAISGYDHGVNFSGSYAGYFDVSIDTFFNNGDERINFSTTITALSDISNLSFSRWLDPDPDVNTYSVYNTTNGRGDSSLGLAPEDWVHAEGAHTGLTIGLYSNSAITHNTGISSGWSTDPLTYLNGTNDGNGDYTIGIGFDIGSLLAGESSTFDYSYVMGDSLSTVTIPGTTVPAPATLWLIGFGLIGFIGKRKKLVSPSR